MMKYKVGDRVRIRKDLKFGELYGGCSFVRDAELMRENSSYYRG